MSEILYLWDKSVIKVDIPFSSFVFPYQNTAKISRFLFLFFFFSCFRESLNQENQDWATDKPDSDSAQATTEVKNGDAAGDTTVEEKPVEEESRELTLDEWKALRNNRAKPQYNLRKAGEGEDLSRWKKMYALEKKKEGADDEEDEEEEYDAAAEYPQRVGRQKRVLGIEIQFSDSRRGSGGRGRGGRGRGGDRVNGRGYGNRGAPRDGDSRGSVSIHFFFSQIDTTLGKKFSWSNQIWNAKL